MKKIVSSIVVVFAFLQLKAQTGNMVFFSEDGFPFRIVMNGVMQNEKAQTNVKIPNLNEGPYKIKVIFDDASQGAIDDKVFMRPDLEQTYSIKKVIIKDSEKRVKANVQNAKDFLKSKEEADANQAKIAEQKERWSIKMLSANPIAVNVTSPSQTKPSGYVQPQSQAQTVHQTTTTTTTSPTNSSNSSNMNIGMNMGGMNMGMNINVNDPEMSNQSQTTTTTQTTTVKPNNAGLNMNVNINGGNTGSQGTTQTTTTQTTTYAATPQQVYVIPGYSGPYGCPYPMNAQEFATAKKSIESKSFEESKFTIAKQICTRKCLLTSQVKEIMLLFTFEQTRLDFAKFAYAYTYDSGNYYQVNDAFTFETSIDDLNSYISNK